MGKEKKKNGRPTKDKYNINTMVERINAYIANLGADIPILKECCLLNDWNYDYVMQLQRKHEKLSQSIKKLLDWKEVLLERGGLTGAFDKTMVIFILKQPAHGWTDKQETQISGGLDVGNPFAGMSTEELRKIAVKDFGDK